MKFWNDIQQYFYRRRINVALQGNKAKRVLTNLNDAKSVGIVYDSTNPDNDIIITRFAETLRKLGKQVEILGFVDDNKIDHKADIQVFNIKGLSWNLVPTDPRALSFAAKKFDLLLACFVNENLPLEYLAATSEAKWRVGPFSSNKTAYYDLMINLGGKNNLTYFLDQAVDFLNRIKYDSN